jgi:hypothetical protein
MSIAEYEIVRALREEVRRAQGTPGVEGAGRKGDGAKQLTTAVRISRYWGKLAA